MNKHKTKEIKRENRKIKVNYLSVSYDESGQRIDNFLITKLKGVPKSHLYRRIRKGEVRVNMKRISPLYRLKTGDQVRIPPFLLAEEAKQAPPNAATIAKLTERILYEDDNLLIMNKPTGMSVHAGSTIRMGVIEALRHVYPKYPQLELAHRLDAETSGCLILAKKKRILREVHALLREGEVTKIYWALTKGIWLKEELVVNVPLQRDYQPTGRYRVEAHTAGKLALTEFHPLKVLKEVSLMEVRLFTGRTHQIRVHAALKGHPIACDDRYGEAEFNRWMRQHGLKRMFLHARSIDFTLPSLKQRITVVAPLDPELEESLNIFSSSD